MDELRMFRRVDFDALAQEARRTMSLTLAAGEENFEHREITPEEFIEACTSAGATVEVEHDPVTGEINSIHATIGLAIQATAPSMLLGDLAQTSVGLTGSETQVIGLAEWTIDWKRKTADATTTDNDTYESSLGSTASWSVKAKYMYIDADPSQSANILAAITSPMAPQTWNFFPTIATGRAAFSGQAYVDGITLSSGMGKVFGLDVSLKGTGRLIFGTQAAPIANANTVTGEQAEV